jgi:hypothetical protein
MIIERHTNYHKLTQIKRIQNRTQHFTWVWRQQNWSGGDGGCRSGRQPHGVRHKKLLKDYWKLDQSSKTNTN